jgi:oligoendopeptidase F
MEKALAVPALGHPRPWIEDLRKEHPHRSRIALRSCCTRSRLTGQAAWNRLFGESMVARRFEVEREARSLEPVLNLLVSKDEGRRRAGAEGDRADPLRKHPTLHPHHQHPRQGQGNL